MSDTGPPGDSEYTEQPGDAGLWARFLAAPTWVKVLIPVAIVALALFIGVWIGQSGSEHERGRGAPPGHRRRAGRPGRGDDHDGGGGRGHDDHRGDDHHRRGGPDHHGAGADDDGGGDDHRRADHGAPHRRAHRRPTAAPPAPPRHDSAADTEPPDTTAPADTEPPDTTAPADTEPTEPDTTPSSDSEPLRPGTVAASLDDLQASWNSAAESTAVAPITSWTPLDVPDHTASVADLGANLRLVALTDGSSGPVTLAVLVWLPLDDPADQPQQNELYRDAFAVLVRSVYPDATTEEQSTLAGELGLSAALPPAEEGASAEATLRRQRYRLAGLDVSGVPGVDTLISVESVLAR